MKFGILRERKSPPDKRVVFSPAMLAEFKKQFPQAMFKIESSDVRIFSDDLYKDLGFEVGEDLTDCDVLLGVKEVPVDALIAGKKYFFFSHTIKKQPHNKKMLQAIIDKDITLYDHETVIDAQGRRLIGFGRYAGLVGTYNAFRAFGIKYELHNLPKAEILPDKDALVARLKKLIFPPLKIVLTGKGKVGLGAKEMLDAIRIKEVSPADFLAKSYSGPVYTHLDVLDYNKRIDGTATTNKLEFYNNPQEFVSDFEKYANVADMYIAGHFYGNNAPDILTREMLRKNNCRIKVVADISCDVDGPIASTIRSSSIANPLYGYNPSTGQEVDIYHPLAVVVMAVDNLPCELPRDASEGFGKMFLDHVVPAFFNDDKDEILKRAAIASNGRLSPRFNYLNDYVKENVPHL
ncbi:NAD(P)-dependent oxidoreductase [Flavobacterium psychrotrophum]|uniref:NAD(P)-dependent oxidoreductase n=1 Tax=Flavobacterium psychrotrophum TaxID=2294119 RepID=UPI000E31A67F|nr:NAD(P)-dependent oxidoreductase [Flavobacterium psychrotrophum]